MKAIKDILLITVVVTSGSLALAAVTSALAQTKISYHPNKLQLSEDVNIGLQMASATEQQFTVLRDEEVSSYVSQLGNRLVTAIPPQFQHPEFRYSFKVIDSSSKGLLSLPGGPVYIDRGLIEAAKNEGELAAVIAHTLSHIVLRHGTADATKEYLAQLSLNSITDNATEKRGARAAQSVASAALTAHLLNSSYETEADILATQTVARAGYDPQALVNLFRTLEREGTNPCAGLDPGADYPLQIGRYKRIEQEASYLKVVNPIQNSARFERTKNLLRLNNNAKTVDKTAALPSSSNASSTETRDKGQSNVISNARLGKVTWGQSAALSPDAKIIAVTRGPFMGRFGVSSTNWIYLVDIITGKERKLGESPTNTNFESLVFSSDGKTLYSSGGDCSIRAWNIRTGQTRVIKKILPGTCGVGHLALSPDGKTLAASVGRYASDGRGVNEVYVLSLQTAVARNMGEGMGVIIHIKFLSNSAVVVLNGYGNLWSIDLASGEAKHLLNYPITICTCIGTNSHNAETSL